MITRYNPLVMSKYAHNNRYCSVCDAEDDLIRCKCHKVYYCSGNCQKAHWEEHSAEHRQHMAAKIQSKVRGNQSRKRVMHHSIPRDYDDDEDEEPKEKPKGIMCCIVALLCLPCLLACQSKLLLAKHSRN